MMLRIALPAAVLIACGPPPAPAPAPAPVANTATTAPAPPPDDAVCCCTFSFADPLDYEVVATWESLATTCAVGDFNRAPGKCIDWRWCGYGPGEEPRTLADRPHLAPEAPLAKGDCCCDIFDGTGETFHVRSAATCASTPDAQCVDEGFCSGVDTPLDNSRKRR